MLDGQGVGPARLGQRFNILRLIDRHGRKLAQTTGNDAHELLRALRRGGRDLIERVAALRDVGTQTLKIVAALRDEVALVCRDDHGPLGQLRRIIAQLGVDLLEVLDRVAVLTAGDIDDVHEQAAAVDVPQEIVAKALRPRPHPR